MVSISAECSHWKRCFVFVLTLSYLISVQYISVMFRISTTFIPIFIIRGYCGDLNCSILQRNHSFILIHRWKSIGESTGNGRKIIESHRPYISRVLSTKYINSAQTRPDSIYYSTIQSTRRELSKTSTSDPCQTLKGGRFYRK